MDKSEPEPIGYLTPRRIAQIVALALALTASVLLLFLPSGVSETVTLGADGSTITETTRTTLVEENGPGVILPLSVPVIAAALPLASLRGNPRALAVVSTAAIGLFIVISMFSVGIFYAPAFGAALLAVFLRGAPREVDRKVYTG